MRATIVCRKTILVPVIPELENVKSKTDREDMKAMLDVEGNAPNSNGYVSMDITAWRLSGKYYWPLNKEEGGTVRRRKIFPCDHTGFGDYCHRCKPNTPRDKKEALAGKYGSKVQRKEESKPGKEVKKNGKEKVKATVKAKVKGEKKQQVKRKGVRGKTGPQKSNNVG
ncbi:MAG TPA: hypothetical protein ENI13_00300 [candidate division CPR3 bacterium]|uniref:DUF7682 domain-containing protein n=1 Tax=candidate division CPR3 bacterium TaxID=2268181 RepID=A0A7C1NM78_UNCC3|nr:hypothetical protein [candidate division CPR3 bacterium]